MLLLPLMLAPPVPPAAFRAARAFFGWRRVDAATRAGIAIRTLRAIETSAVACHWRSAERLKQMYEAVEVEFSGEGVILMSKMNFEAANARDAVRRSSDSATRRHARALNTEPPKTDEAAFRRRALNHLAALVRDAVDPDRRRYRLEAFMAAARSWKLNPEREAKKRKIAG
jgi:hypothetical protein